MEEKPNSAKCLPALGPFPRYIWIHQATPPDRLDRACYDIWRRTQSLPIGLKPKYTSLLPRKSKEAEAEHRVEPVTDEKDEITHMVEQEYMNLILENLIDCFNVTNENNDIVNEVLANKVQTLKMKRLKTDTPEEKILPINFNKCWSRKATSTKHDICNSECCKTKGQSLAQIPVQTAQALNATTKTVLSTYLKTRDITVVSKTGIPRTETQHIEKRQQLPVFSKLCFQAHASKIRHSSGFAPMPNVFPEMVRSRHPAFSYVPPPSSMFVGAMSHSNVMRFSVPYQNFSGHYQHIPMETEKDHLCEV
uniref:Uncharacterized protein n=1 Tax=Pyxicephalus adspersus TaxID=30357 RepID=A0AAV3AZT7_PYXAD|nr:TPA: hypothetical protein GDO54_001230 [Pyxicephalus adspersus]